ncbi:MAG: glycosyltransferase [Lentisphaeria bacterium]
MELKKNLHTFVISAWKESPFIEDTVKSLLNQSYHSKIMIATSSPNDFLKNLCLKYGIDYRINLDVELAESAVNWSYAYAQADTKYVTLAHQDDLYLPDYTLQMVELAEKQPNAVMEFCRCFNYTNGKRLKYHPLLLMKDILLLPYFLKHAIYSKKLRFYYLGLGNPICCPSVMFNKELIGDFEFDSEVKVNLDWEAWLRLAQYDGAFLFSKKRLLLRRIHDDSGTTLTYNNGSRRKDDLTFFCKFWPKPVASLLARLYNLAEFLN